MGGHDLMTTETLCRLQNRAAAAHSSSHSGAIVTSPELQLARPMADGLGVQGDQNGEESEGILTGLFTELGKASR
jgi:hypothetical protein